MKTIKWLQRVFQKSALLDVLGETAFARGMTAKKTCECMKRNGAQITGFILTDKGGNVTLVNMGAVRWMPEGTAQRVMND